MKLSQMVGKIDEEVLSLGGADDTYSKLDTTTDTVDVETQAAIAELTAIGNAGHTPTDSVTQEDVNDETQAELDALKAMAGI